MSITCNGGDLDLNIMGRPDITLHMKGGDDISSRLDLGDYKKLIDEYLSDLIANNETLSDSTKH